VIRTAVPADLDAVHQVFCRWAEQVAEHPIALWVLESEWSAPGFDVEHDHWVAEHDGMVVGYAALKPNATVVARGEERAELLALAAERARERGDGELEAILTTVDEDGLAALAAAGWLRVRDVYRMWLDLDREPPEPRLPADVSVRPYEPADSRSLHTFVDLAYASNNERTEPYEQWLHFMTSGDDFDPAYWHLAEGPAGDLVACCLTWAPSDGRGWVKDLAVHPDRRRQGLGEALLHLAARRYRDAGTERVGLKVDADNPTGASRLYERVGYVTDRTYAIFTKQP
jgi:mycothiol synthase